MLQDLTRQAVTLERSGVPAGRLRSPGDLVARMRPRFREAGITRLAQITGLDQVGIPVWAAIRPNAASLSVCQGKGMSDEAAQASGVMEAFEMSVAESVAAQRVGSCLDLERDGAAYDTLPALVRLGHAPPAPDERIGWVRGHDLLGDRPVWVLDGAVRVDATDPFRRYWQSTHGLGSGSLMLEAVLHGLQELIERDCGEFWNLRSDDEVDEACVAPADLASQEVASLAAAVARAGLELRLFDITSDVGVPAFFATVSPPLDGSEAAWTHYDLASGMGCRLDAGAAAAAAILEAVQSRLTTISGARDDYQPDTYAWPLAPDLLVYPRARPCARPALPRLRETGRPLDRLLDRLRAVGIDEVLVVPLKEDDDVAVAKVIVMDLELPPGERSRPHGRRLAQAFGEVAS